jgi:hypothetical protein
MKACGFPLEPELPAIVTAPSSARCFVEFAIPFQDFIGVCYAVRTHSTNRYRGIVCKSQDSDRRPGSPGDSRAELFNWPCAFANIGKNPRWPLTTAPSRYRFTGRGPGKIVPLPTDAVSPLSRLAREIVSCLPHLLFRHATSDIAHLLADIVVTRPRGKGLKLSSKVDR